MNFKRGINIGNHFESSKSTKDFKYPIKPWYAEFIKECGFDHIRLPVKWDCHCDKDNGFKIDSEFMALVKRAADEFLNQGLYVILNIHHFREAMDDPKANEQALILLWEQIAAEFQDYPDTLVFEAMNEPTWRCTATDWNDVQNNIIATIRKSNPTRQIMICGIDYSGLFKLKEVFPPKDDKNLIGTFHYYFPVEFTHQGAAWSKTYCDLHDIEWTGSEDEVKWCVDAMREAKEWSEKNGLPVNLGEFGVYSKADEASRCKWTKCVVETALAYGFSFTYWELCSSFGICYPDRPELKQPLADCVIK